MKVTSYKEHVEKGAMEVVVERWWRGEENGFKLADSKAQVVLFCIAAAYGRRNLTPVRLTAWVPIHEIRRMVLILRTAFTSRELDLEWVLSLVSPSTSPCMLQVSYA